MPSFDVYGPFVVKRDGQKCLRDQDALWTEVDKVDGLSGAIGCYVFCLEWNGFLKPWYVGMTVARDGFKGEAFQPHKLQIFSECMAAHNGAPMLFLFPLMSLSWERFSTARVTGKKSIAWLERTLMSMAFAQNDQLSNVRDMGNLKNVEVLGLLGPPVKGRPHREVTRVRQALLGR